MQEKIGTVANDSARLGLKVLRGKSKVLKNNAEVSTTPITLEGDGLEDVTSFTYLGNSVDKQVKPILLYESHCCNTEEDPESHQHLREKNSSDSMV